MIGPPAAREYAVEPVGVLTIIPSARTIVNPFSIHGDLKTDNSRDRAFRNHGVVDDGALKNHFAFALERHFEQSSFTDQRRFSPKNVDRVLRTLPFA